MASLFSCSLPEEMADKFRALAISQHRSMNNLIREGIGLVLAKYGDDQC